MMMMAFLPTGTEKHVLGRFFADVNRSEQQVHCLRK